MALCCEYEIPAKYYLLTKAPKPAEDEVDLFGDDDAVDLKAVMAAKKADAEKKKPKKVVVAKSSFTFRALPADGDVDISNLYETAIRKIEIDGLLWGMQCQVVDGPFGLKGIQFGCVIEDEKVRQDDIEEALETIGLSEDDKKKYIEMRRSGDLDDYEEEWPGKMVGSLQVVSLQKI